MRFRLPIPQASGREILDLLIESIYLAAVFLIPLWFAYWFRTYNIFELNKMILFKVLVSGLLFLTVIRAAVYPASAGLSVRRYFKKYWLIPSIFIAGLSLALWGSLNPSQSFYGTLERQQGLVSYAFYFLWFILLSYNLSFQGPGPESRPRRIKRVIKAGAASGFFVALYGILQVFNIDFLTWAEAPSLTHRTFSTFGQPNFLASWLLLVIPLSFYLFREARRAIVKAAWFLTGALGIICLFMTGSRSGLLALFFAAALWIAYSFFTSSLSRRIKVISVLVLIILSGLAFLSLDIFSGGRVRALSRLDYGSLGARVNIYKAAVSAIEQRPWLGYGLENQGAVFIRYYSPDWGIAGDVSQTADRAHNLVLDILLVGGLAALVLFSALFFYFFRLAYRNLRSSAMPGLAAAIGLGGAAYLFSLLVNFSIVSTEIYFWLFLAVLAALNFSETVPAAPSKVRVRPLAVVAVVALSGVLTAWLIMGAVRQLMGDYYFNEIMLALRERDYPAALAMDAYLDRQAIDPASREAYEAALGEELSSAYPLLVAQPEAAAIKNKIARIDASLVSSSSNYRVWLAKADMESVLGNFSSAQADLSRVIAWSPQWPVGYLAQAHLDSAAGRPDAALAAYEQASANLPDARDPRLNADHRRVVLNNLYFIDKNSGDLLLGQKKFAQAEERYQAAFLIRPEDSTLLKKIADTYYLRGDRAAAFRYTAQGYADSPKDYKWPLALAALSFEGGDVKKAEYYLSRAAELEPDNQEIKAFKAYINK